MSATCSWCAGEEEAERRAVARGGARALLRGAPDEAALRALAAAPPQPLLDALAEQLRCGGERRAAALACLAALAARRPAWAARLPAHPAAGALLAAARAAAAVPLLHALLALAALLPAAPALAAPHWPDLAALLLRPALLAPPPPAPLRDHLLLAQRALFMSLYAMFPCSLVEALRAEVASSPYRDVLEEALAPLIKSVRLHPSLVMGSRHAETECTKWTRLEPHDVLAEACELNMENDRETTVERSYVLAPVRMPEEDEASAGSALAVSRGVAAVRAGAAGWFSLAERLGAGSAPHTPLPEGSPPEPAVEATPENTPAKETRAAFRFPTESLAVRALGRSPPPAAPGAPQPAAPAAEGAPGRLARVLAERRAALDPAPEPPALSAAPPASRPLPRPAPRRPAPHPDPPLVPRSDPRALPPPRCPHGPVPPARPRSAPPSAPRSEVAVQTVHHWPEPYEFIISDFYKQLPKDPVPIQPAESPSSAVEAALGGGGELAVLRASLQYERWRREQHAERNRRLLGRCRAARAADLLNGRLAERVRALEAERDALRARLRARADRPPAGPPPDPRAEEARARAEADAAAARAAERAARAAEQEARAGALAAGAALRGLEQAARAAELGAAAQRRLRRDLLLLGERHARLLAAAPPAAAPRPEAQAARLKAEHDAQAATARADATGARAAELEAALAARDQQLAALRRSSRLAAAEQAARAQALQDKYSCLLRVVRVLHTQRLLDGLPPPPELLAAYEPAARPTGTSELAAHTAGAAEPAAHTAGAPEPAALTSEGPALAPEAAAVAEAPPTAASSS